MYQNFMHEKIIWWKNYLYSNKHQFSIFISFLHLVFIACNLISHAYVSLTRWVNSWCLHLINFGLHHTYGTYIRYVRSNDKEWAHASSILSIFIYFSQISRVYGWHMSDFVTKNKKQGRDMASKKLSKHIICKCVFVCRFMTICLISDFFFRQYRLFYIET